MPEPAEALGRSLPTEVPTGSEAAAEVGVERGDVPHRSVKNSWSGSLEVASPPPSQTETFDFPDGIIDGFPEFCEELPEPPSDLCVWEDEGMDSVQGEWNQVGKKTNDVGEVIISGTPDEEPGRVPACKRGEGPEADVCTLAHKGEDVLCQMAQQPVESSESPVGSPEEIEIAQREGEQQSAEGGTDIQVVELLDVHDLDERMKENKEEKRVQKDEAGIPEAPKEESGEVFDEQASKDKGKREDLEPIESDSTEESVPNDEQDRKDGKNQDKQERTDHK